MRDQAKNLTGRSLTTDPVYWVDDFSEPPKPPFAKKNTVPPSQVFFDPAKELLRPSFARELGLPHAETIASWMRPEDFVELTINYWAMPVSYPFTARRAAPNTLTYEHRYRRAVEGDLIDMLWVEHINQQITIARLSGKLQEYFSYVTA